MSRDQSLWRRYVTSKSGNGMAILRGDYRAYYLSTNDDVIRLSHAATQRHRRTHASVFARRVIRLTMMARLVLWSSTYVSQHVSSLQWLWFIVQSSAHMIWIVSLISLSLFTVRYIRHGVHLANRTPLVMRFSQCTHHHPTQIICLHVSNRMDKAETTIVMMQLNKCHYHGDYYAPIYSRHLYVH
jgi:hypothetical protein